MSHPYILTVSNRKGGSGKSTTVVNLAAEWAAEGNRVLVIDLDTQGHSGLGLGVAAAADGKTAHDIFRDMDFNLEAAIVPTVTPNIDCVPADHLFDGLGAIRKPSMLKRKLEEPSLRGRYDLIIIDTPPALDYLLINALAAADGVLVPMMPHALSAEGVRQLARLIYRIATLINPDLHLVALVPVMLNPLIRHHRDVIHAMQAELGRDRLLSGIRTDITLAEAFARRQPVRAFAPRSRGAVDYGTLAGELPHLWNWNLNSSLERRRLA